MMTYPSQPQNRGGQPTGPGQPQPPQGYGQPQPPQGYGQQQPTGAQTFTQPGPTGYPDPGAYAQHMDPVPKKSKTPMIIAGVLAIALIVSGAAFAFWYFRGGAQPQAAKALPADTSLLLEANLAPDPAQQQAVAAWTERIPNLKDSKDDDNYKKAVFNAFREGTNSDLPEWSEVEPWLGDSAALAGIIARESELIPVVVLHTIDKAKAEEYAKSTESQYTFVGDSLLMWQDPEFQIDAEAVQADSLQSSENYTNLKNKVPGNALATVYMDFDRLKETFTDTMGSPLEASKALDGLALAGGVTATNDVLQLEIATTHREEIKGGENVLGMVGDLSADWEFTGGASYTDKDLQTVWDALVTDREYELRRLGISDFEDFKALLGSSIVGGFSGLINNDPSAGIKVKGGAPDQREEFLDSNPDGEYMTEGDVTYISSGHVSPEEVKSPSSKLRDLPAFQNAIAGTNSAQLVLFVNTAKLREEPAAFSGNQEAQELLEKIAGVGMTSTADGNSTKSIIRVVAEG